MWEMALNTALWGGFLVALASIYYGVDRTWGVRAYRAWYNLTHEHPLSADAEHGFIYGQSTARKISMLAAVALVQSTLAVVSTGNVLTEIVMFFVEVPVMLLGFNYAGPPLFRLWRRKEAVYDLLDGHRPAEESDTTGSSPTSADTEDEVAAEPEPTPRDLIDQFTHRKSGGRHERG